jgi:hypothetical protein
MAGLLPPVNPACAMESVNAEAGFVGSLSEINLCDFDQRRTAESSELRAGIVR